MPTPTSRPPILATDLLARLATARLSPTEFISLVAPHMAATAITMEEAEEATDPRNVIAGDIVFHAEDGIVVRARLVE